MDTLFRLVSLQQSSEHHQHQQQQSSFNSSRTSSNSSHQLLFYQQPQEEECYNNYYYYQKQHHLYMDEDFSSSSSSKHHHQQAPPPPHPTTTATPLFDPADFSLPHVNFSSPSSSTSSAPNGGRWATDLLLGCAQAVAARDNTQVQKLMWMLNELSSPYGDAEQKLASYFLQALFARITASGPRALHTLSAASDRTCSFDSTRRVALRFQDLSPWQSFGHVASNGAILESFLSTSTARLHILDLSTTFCTQWPTLLEALATRSSDETPHLSITTVLSSSSSSSTHRVMKEIAARMEKFARLMGVPFNFHTVHHDGDLSNLDFSALDLRDAALAVNFVNSLHGVPPHRREAVLSAIRGLRPRIVTVVEEEANLADDDEEAFVRVFGEGMRFFSAYFDSLEESFPRTSSERLALERAAGRAVMDLVACPAAESRERRETAGGWSRRMRAAGFEAVAFSDDVLDDVRALLRRYREGWSMRTAAEEAEGAGGAAGIFLAWKEQPVVWASAWRP